MPNGRITTFGLWWRSVIDILPHLNNDLLHMCQSLTTVVQLGMMCGRLDDSDVGDGRKNVADGLDVTEGYLVLSNNIY